MTPAAGRLGGKVALITGAARGMGASHARRFAEEGAAVVVADVLHEEGAATAAELREAGLRADFVALDVTDPDAWRGAVRHAVDAHGALHVLVNNAGVSDSTPIVETTDALWDRIVGVNQRGVFLGMRTAIPAIAASGGGAVVNISSVYGLRSSRGFGAYHAAKAAVLRMTETAAADHAADGVRVNAVCPGLVVTPMSARHAPETVQALIDTIPMRRGADPSEISNGVLFLASDEASFVTGATLLVDGGQLAV